MSPNVMASNSTLLQVTLNFELEYMNISGRHFNSNFSHSLNFHCLVLLTNFAKYIDLLWMGSLCHGLLYKCSIYTLKSDQWITIWWAKFELECLLLIFIYFNPKFKVTCKNGNFECRYIKTHSKEKTSKIYNNTFAILPFSHQNTFN